MLDASGRTDFQALQNRATSRAGLATVEALRDSAWAMPHIERRPLTLVRCHQPITRDDALRSACKFLRHTAASQPGFEGVPRISIPEKEKVGEYLYVDTPRSLATLVANGVLELHVWNARVDDVEHPDRVVFDLDPGDGATWPQVIAAARRLREHLASLELESWPRTTGGKGLHIVVPFRRGPTWEEVYAWSKDVAETVARGEASLTTAFEKHHRAGKILIDYKRNHRGAPARSVDGDRSSRSTDEEARRSMGRLLVVYAGVDACAGPETASVIRHRHRSRCQRSFQMANQNDPNKQRQGQGNQGQGTQTPEQGGQQRVGQQGGEQQGGQREREDDRERTGQRGGQQGGQRQGNQGAMEDDEKIGQRGDQQKGGNPTGGGREPLP